MTPTHAIFWLSVSSFVLGASGSACSASAPTRDSSPEDRGTTSAGGATEDICIGAGCDGEDGFGAVGPDTSGVCGDGQLSAYEACDDGKQANGDGCSSDCLVVEPGYLCHEPGTPCRPFVKCGDGRVSFPEQCDDGNSAALDGCSATCKVEVGWKCDAVTGLCSKTTCGDSIPEGAELCDDGNTLPFDGCGVECQIEPQCAIGAGCTSLCGDGVVLGAEACDDANDVDGDGCSAECQIEAGYDCPGAPCEEINGECVLRVPAIFRDFPASHPDMEDNNFGNPKGMVGPLLDDEGKPIAANVGTVTGLSEWYRDFQGGNTGPNLGEIVLFDDGTGRFINRFLDDGTRWEAPVGSPACQSNDNNNMPCPVDGNPGFFPVDAIEMPADTERFIAEAPQEFYGGYGIENEFPEPHNFHFTTEVSYWFVFDPAATAELTFVGDDDVWVFINGQLAVDIGGLHVPTGGRIRLEATTATVGYSTDQSGTTWTETPRPITDFGLMAGGAYEIKVFHAERQTKASSFQLTLAGFDTSRSDCTPACGDGIIGVGEECDDGENDGGHNECQPGCLLGGYCGDGIVQEEETCDDADPNAPSGCIGCRVVVVR